jgi:hypothetical protein
MLLCIPSRSRATELLTGPLIRELPLNPDLGHQVCVFVPPEQFRSYNDRMPRNVFVVPTEGPIGETRHAIGWEAYRLGHENFMMIDDDVGFLIRRDNDTWRLRGTSSQENLELFDYIEEVFNRERTVSHISISSREGNNFAGVGDAKTLEVWNTRAMRAVAWRTEDFLSLEHDRIEFMEDFDYSLQSISRGRENICLYYWAQGQKETNAPGGCSDYRSRLRHDKCAIHLANLFPDFVTVRTKENKTGTLAERLEVTIQWKVAAQYGEKFREKFREKELVA